MVTLSHYTNARLQSLSVIAPTLMRNLGDPNDIPSRWHHGPGQLNVFLASLDLLVITLPLTSLTLGMIACEQFQALGKRNDLVSHVGRGPIVNTDDLVADLNSSTIRGAAVDVRP